MRTKNKKTGSVGYERSYDTVYCSTSSCTGR